MEDLFNLIKSEADMLAVLIKCGEEFSFLSITFDTDIDLYKIVESNPVSGITLLNKKDANGKSPFLKKISPEFNCSGLQFDKPVSFFNCKFNNPTNFNNTVFSNGVRFRASTFEGGLSLVNVRATGLSSFGFITSKSVTVINCLFTMADKGYVETIVDGNCLIENTSFNSGLNLSRCKVNGQLSFNNVKFNGQLSLMEARIGSLHIGSFRDVDASVELKEFDISEAEFSGQIQLVNIIVKGVFRSRAAIFNENVFLINVKFNSDTYLNHTTFHKSIYIEHVIVSKNISFYGATFNSKINFNDIDFSNANVSFTGCYINADLWIGKLLHQDATVFNGLINFEGAIISPLSIVRIFNLNNSQSPSGTINFKNALIRGLVDIRNVFINEITFDGTVVSGNIQDNNSLQNAIKDRNTARLLKHEAKRINNIISAVSYTKLEMELYAKNIKVRQISDWLILKLNYWSNNYGTNWLKGVWFTFYTGFGCYSLFFLFATKLTFRWSDRSTFILLDGKFWSGFLNYFWLPYGFKELATDYGVAGHIPGAFFFVAGKILIAYGVYQIIAAFRKYI